MSTREHEAGKLAEDVELREYVQGKLEQRWSPEQISRTLPTAFPTHLAALERLPLPGAPVSASSRARRRASPSRRSGRPRSC
jgi:hypothetical protein